MVVILLSTITMLFLDSPQVTTDPPVRSNPLAITRVDQAVSMDGRADDPVWDTIDPLPMISYEPVPGLPPSERTEVRFAYDDNYIYASIRAYDSDPTQIRLNTLFRDRLSGDDYFHIVLDTYNDYESAVFFTVLATGAKRDGLISNDGEGGLNADYMTYWDAETHIDERGWFADVRIPFSSLGFQDRDGSVQMGLLVQRGIQRKNEGVFFPHVPSHIDRPFSRPSLAHRVVFDGIHSRRPIHITPYISGGISQATLPDPEHDRYVRDNSSDLNVGADIKYSISNNLNLDVTVNTDFAQAEADDQQANLTRFDLFFPEKRQFFQERSSIFDLNTGENGRLFHSRRIGLTETGEPIRILGGGRLTGRISSWDFGFLNMQTDSYQESLSENFGVLRLRRNVINNYSYMGIMTTSRVDMDGNYNLGLGFDGTVRLGNHHYLMYTYAQTLEEDSREDSHLDRSLFRIYWERRSREGFSYQTTFRKSGGSYNPGVGFVPRVNFYQFEQQFQYGWVATETSRLLAHSLNINSTVYWAADTQKLETVEFGPEWSGRIRSGDQFSARVTYFYESIPAEFSLLGRATISAGEYEFVRAAIGYQIPGSELFRGRIEVDAGTFYGGRRAEVSISPTWNVSRHLELEGRYIYNLVDVESVDDWFVSHVGQLRARAALNTRFTTLTFIQFNSSADLMAVNIRFRYNFRDGNDLWIVLNQGMNMNRDRNDFEMPLTNDRTALLKYTYTFHY